MVKRMAFMTIALFVGVSLIGCASDQLDGPRVSNEDPTVWLSAAPPEGTVTKYTLHLYWGGWDPDGEIRYYEYCITDNETGVFEPADTTGRDKWRKVYRNDSTFVFSADVVADSASLDPETLEPVQFLRSHTFFVRAVDEQGLASRKPAYRSFTSTTLSPVVDVTIPRATGYNPAEVPPITTFTWQALDYINNQRETQQPDSVRWILVPLAEHNDRWDLALKFIRENPHAEGWHDWAYYQAPDDSGKSWTTPPLDIGLYMFAVQVKDEAGAVSPVFDPERNVRRLSVTPRVTGPVLTVNNKYLGTIVTSSPNTAPAIIDLPADIQMCFRVTANAASYGGVASGWRYGWDLQDPSVPSQWETDYTPFVREVNDVPTADVPCRVWSFDSHQLYVEAIDNSGYTSRAIIQINVVPFNMSKSVFLVDDWNEGGSRGWGMSGGNLPNDAEHDEFWQDMLSEVAGFDPVRDVLEIGPLGLPLTAFADYKAVIWAGNAAYNGTTQSYIYNILRWVNPEARVSAGKAIPNVIALFMAAGGKVLLAGQNIMCASINREAFGTGTFPLIFRYELAGDQDGDYGPSSDVGVRGIGEESFGYQDCCLNVLDVAYIGVPNLIRRAGRQACPINRFRPVPQSGAKDGIRVAIPYSSGTRVFPTLELRPECSEPGMGYAILGLNGDIYNPPYFANIPKGTDPGPCNDIAELEPPRACIEPIYLNGCADLGSKIYEAPIAFWTTVHADTIPGGGGALGGRSVVMGFHPVYFKPSQFKEAMNIILFEEWGLPHK